MFCCTLGVVGVLWRFTGFIFYIDISLSCQVHEPSIPADLLQTQPSSGLEFTSLSYGAHPTLFVATNNGTLILTVKMLVLFSLCPSLRIDYDMGHNRK